ncbi:hypothetical protein BABINDRAFT_163519 [Babjeviella inositovora NRRL Y-12698]|uniref:Phospholipase A-2-activating protein n=1 Tax=Babjeviella inositovora NRRL Y-12698 TaxID=984486 RepID=A0A1E3QIJ3_9ASCO|nr:uncharacterized protein BABINDRAFT_163519 [Babjeviella inositovora NRRL Y-12698]ODQ77516.1 hypothetical protein BABINDRAFT_163519 [Babjeviella inositovora NRRL Y-12698]
MQFKLSATLSAHEDDVRAATALSDTSIVSASRDETVRVWTKDSTWTSALLYKSASYINSVAYIPELSLVVFAGNDATIWFVDPASSDLEALITLPAHDMNVCALHYVDGLLASSSWDGTAKVWDVSQALTTGPRLLHELRGHESAVWDIKILNAAKREYVTCSADQTIRTWIGDREVLRFSPHTDVVRSLLPLPFGIASCSNDGTIAILSSEGRLITTLKGHTSFVYQLALLPSGELVSCGEDRTVRVWNDSECVQVITLPAISIWTVAVQPNSDIIAGSSDNQLRVFTRDPSRYADEASLQGLADEIKGLAISENTMQSNVGEDLPGLEALQTPGTKEGQTIMVKNELTVEAHQWSSSAQEWVKIGEVVGRGGTGSDKKVEYSGAKWDFLFDVDIEDGAPALKLPYNINENPYIAAERFLSMNELPLSYSEQVVQFILSNTKGISIGGPEKTYDPYQDRNPLELLPVKQHLYFDKVDVETLSKGLAKFRESETEFAVSQADIDTIKASLSLLTANVDEEVLVSVYEFASKIIQSWSVDSKVIGFDLLRAIIPFHQREPENFKALVTTGFLCDSPLILLMLLRCFDNLFRTGWGKSFFTTEDPTSQFDVLEVLITVNDEYSKALLSATKPAQLAQLSVALATLYYNLSVLCVWSGSAILHTKLLAALNHVAEELIVRGDNEEAAYRVIVGLGNLLTVKRTAKPKWLSRIREKYGVTGASRFVIVWEDIEKI